METSDVSVALDATRYYVYILFSLKDKGLYIGYTTDLKKRLSSHSQGKNTATKFRTPFKLIHYEYFINIKDAKAREKFLKSGFGRKQIKEALKRTLASHTLENARDSTP
ncbi:MAG: GIY-YIG nuclease family protein [Microgenomates group bacterium]|jgi:putative endonuclease